MAAQSESRETAKKVFNSKQLRPGRADSAKKGSKHFREAIQECSPVDVLWRVECADIQLGTVDALAALAALARSPEAEAFTADMRVRQLVSRVALDVTGGTDSPQVLSGTAWALAKLMFGNFPLSHAIASASRPKIQEF
mmetsp:Transcript_59543/g.105588  ORF Transcript_59543/g.105588 Transcript_59543/m.105588 type:complete len:139 (-) Transcript_59543:94-510(-)